ncbi:ABC transporter permease/M1 family aminopeptidase [Paraflavitalea pollutisoli]|uniref:ABC transporter permease/M1 family aminopeptidase n=1 Tax=Paraflavitalea pollutisoli TaxID=3034143 RepID=UPI0023EAD177|nr:ABC transporter permease [Paraflavitalea sp. H1-2-19X]
MKLAAIIRFEMAYQLKRLATWLFFAVVGVVCFLLARENFLADAMYDDFYLNAPFVIAVISVFGCLIWLLAAAPIAGEAAARDVQTGMYALIYTLPISKGQYLVGRFIAAFLTNAIILLGVLAGIMLAVYLPGVDAKAIGPFRAVAYWHAYGVVCLPNAFIATALQFSLSALAGRTRASYAGSLILFFFAYIISILVSFPLGQPELGKLVDPVGVVIIVSSITFGWTPAEKSTRLMDVSGILLWNRLLWTGIGVLLLVITHWRFRFAHRVPARRWWHRWLFPAAKEALADAPVSVLTSPISRPAIAPAFGTRDRLRQLWGLSFDAFLSLAKSRAGWIVWGAILFLTVSITLINLDLDGVPLIPRTDYLVLHYAAPLTNPYSPWILLPLLIIYYAAELVWREREAGISELVDTAPLPEWLLFASKCLALALVLAVLMSLMVVAAILVQLFNGYHAFEIGLLIQAFLGLRLVEYLLFGVLILVIQVVVNQKYIGLLCSLLAYSIIAFSSIFGIEHHLLLYGTSPAWNYSQMRGYGGSLKPWVWFTIYWASWALVLSIAARLLWVRGKDQRWRTRWRMVWQRLSGNTGPALIMAAGFMLAMGGYLFFETVIVNQYASKNDDLQRRADYENKFSHFANKPRPTLTAMKLQVDLFPEQHSAEVHGVYQLVNQTSVAIDSLHLFVPPQVDRRRLNTSIKRRYAVWDGRFPYSIYVLEKPLQPGDTMQLEFVSQHWVNGFTNNGVSQLVTGNGTMLTDELLPAIGYQSKPELLAPGERRRYGLPERPVIPSLEGYEAAPYQEGIQKVQVDATLSTVAGQVAVTKGELQKHWTKGNREFYHYVTESPIPNSLAFYSARYAMKEKMWQGIAIQLYYHPGHTINVERILLSAQASLQEYSEQFGPYPYKVLKVLEHPGLGIGMHSESGLVTSSEGFTLFNPGMDNRGMDLPYAVVAHEMGHQWWGGQLPYASVQGAPVLSEGLAWYSAMGVVEATKGSEALWSLRRFMRQPYPFPPIKMGVPLLQAMDPWQAYRKGPFAFYALQEYIGRPAVSTALRQLLQKHAGGKPPLATTLDLYRELQAVTPDSLQYLLHDLFAANSFWELKTEQVDAKSLPDGQWQLSLAVKARKFVIDPSGKETDVPMNDWIELGAFDGERPVEKGAPYLYLQRHRIHSGSQQVVVTVPRKPVWAGIDPRYLLIDLKTDDNTKAVGMVKP